jgi:hypothetical protein
MKTGCTALAAVYEVVATRMACAKVASLLLQQYMQLSIEFHVRTIADEKRVVKSCAIILNCLPGQNFVVGVSSVR